MSIINKCETPHGIKMDRSPERSTVILDGINNSAKKSKKKHDCYNSSIQQSLKMKKSKITDYNSPHSQISATGKILDSDGAGNSTIDDDDWLDNELKEYNYKLYSSWNVAKSK